MWGKATVLGGAIFAVLAWAGTAGASHQGDADGPNEFAVGSAKNRAAEFTSFPFSLQVSAHRRPDGQVTGHVRGFGDLNGDLPGGDFYVEGPVTCLRVEPKPGGDPGHRAAIKYRFKNTRGAMAPPEGWVVEVFIEDNGEPRSGQPVDGNGTLAPLPPEVANPDQCEDPNVAGQPYNPVDSGNYTVRDGVGP